MKRMLNKIFSELLGFKYRRCLMIVLHAFLVTAAFTASFMLRFDFNVSPQYAVVYYSFLPIFVGVQLIVYDIFGLYAGMWRLVSALDIWNIIKANVTAIIILILFQVTVFHLGEFPRSIFIIDGLLCIGLMSLVRIVTRLFREGLLFKFETFRSAKQKARILVVGAGSAGVSLLSEYRRNPGSGRVIGFIDDDPLKQGECLQGVNVRGRRQDIPRIVGEYKIDEIILAIPSADGKTVRSILDICHRTGARIKVVPGLMQIIDGNMELKSRDVLPEDLLGRETVTINDEEVTHYIDGRTVLITGAGGSIGSEISRQIAAFGPKELLLFDHHENNVYFLSIEIQNKFPALPVRTVIGDIRDVGLLKHLFSSCRPQVVFHAAAHKHVPLMEGCPVAAVKNNIFGSRNLIYASHHYGAERFVLISTDKAVNPLNAMGMSKCVAEMVLQAKAARSRTKFMAVRFGNVLGSAGSVVPLFKRQIENGGPVTVTHPNVRRYFMSIKEAVLLVLQAGALGEGGELFILDMGEQIKVIDIAKNLIALSGLTLGRDIEIKFTGLRPGEKMEEELLLDKEKDAVTNHNKIFISHYGETYDRYTLQRDLRELHRLTELMDEAGIMPFLKKIVDGSNKGRHSPAC